MSVSFRSLLSGLLLCSVLANAAPIDNPRLARSADVASDWLSHGRDWQETRYSPLRQIDSGNVADLSLAWYLDLSDTRGLQATPLVADGVIYLSGNWSVARAVDARTGALLWEYDPRR